MKYDLKTSNPTSLIKINCNTAIQAFLVLDDSIPKKMKYIVEISERRGDRCIIQKKKSKYDLEEQI